MSDYQQLQQQFATDIECCLNATPRDVSDNPMNGPLIALINALPFYGDANFIQVHRGGLINLLQVSLPNAQIAPEPSSFNLVSIIMSYTGPYSGYRDAFYTGISPTAAGQAVATQVQSAQSGLNSDWWSRYGVSILSDAIRISTSIPLDTGKLSDSLSSAHSALLPALTASYLGVYSQGYSPTSTALRVILNSGQGPQTAQLLAQAITRGQFTANINQSIAFGGDSTNAAVWFLFNLWVTLKALGADNVDAIIEQSKNQGLTVPAQVGPGSWWNGGYTQWYSALNGNDVQAQIAARISEAMPERETVIQRMPPDGFPVTSNFNVTVNNGYPLSLCQWGSLNWFPPPSSSCFGKGTRVLMADGTGKPIETLKVGDEVYSSQGARKIVLIESPERRERSLWQLNNLPIFATAAHPFRTHDAEKCVRAAIDPWGAMDSVPSMIANGICALTVNTELSGLQDGQPSAVCVTEIEEHPVTSEDEPVYDLLLEDWTQDYVTWFVGGPSIYVAVDTETADPAYDRLCTLAVVSAMNSAIDACRTHFSGKEHTLGQAIASLDLEAMLPGANNPQSSADKLVLPRVPDTSFFMQNGEWDSCASQLEAQLIRHHARGIRRQLYPPQGPRNATADQWFFALRDIELKGDYAPPPDSSVFFKLTYYRSQDSEKSWDTVLETSAISRCFLAPDTLITIDSPLIPDGTMAIRGQLYVESRCQGEFYCDGSALDFSGRITEHFLYHPGGQITGRLAFSVQQNSGSLPVGLNAVGTLALSGQTQKMHSAVTLGQSLGQQLARIQGVRANQLFP